MSIALFAVLGAVAVVAVYAVQIYNGLVRLKHGVGKAWSNIDVLLKQRHDELPKLVEVCKQYMTHERETLESVTRARGAVAQAQESADVAALGAAETALRGSLGKLFALAEAYPQLKADRTFANLAERISQLESSISDRRELYNESVTLNNARREQFPDSLVAGWGDFKAFDLLKFSDEEKKDVDVKALFSK
jgi:LemA protein